MQVYYFLGRKQRKLLFAFVFLTHIPDYNFALFFVPLFFLVCKCSAFTHGAAPRRGDLILPVTKMISVLVYCPVLRINISRTMPPESRRLLGTHLDGLQNSVFAKGRAAIHAIRIKFHPQQVPQRAGLFEYFFSFRFRAVPVALYHTFHVCNKATYIFKNNTSPFFRYCPRTVGIAIPSPFQFNGFHARMHRLFTIAANGINHNGPLHHARQASHQPHAHHVVGIMSFIIIAHCVGHVRKQA